jgi:GDP-mannose 6-dehydrogenase
MSVITTNSPATGLRRPAPSKTQRISIFGLGYVGSVSAASLANAGHTVLGVEIVPDKVQALRHGKTSFFEPGLADLVKNQVAEKRLDATSDALHAVLNTDVSFVSVGTPSLRNGKVDTSGVEAVCREIGRAIAQKDTRHVIVMRSTVLPGTCERCIEIISEESGLSCPEGFGFASNPEFLREGAALKDYASPPFTVVGATCSDDARLVAQLYEHLEAPVFITELAVAETVKYACNLFHAVKVCFANEVGRICAAIGVDSHDVMDVFCADKKLNLSSYYLKPGYAYGGSCLPKDLRAILALAREQHIFLPMLEQIQQSNQQQIELAIDLVNGTETSRVGVLGFSFKANTDDLRESPHIALIKDLVGQGKHVRIFDTNICSNRLMGANRRFIEQSLPHFRDLMADTAEEVLEFAECVVIGNNDPVYRAALGTLRPDQVVVDLVRVEEGCQPNVPYHGLSWTGRRAA